jgi:predicted deacylase
MLDGFDPSAPGKRILDLRAVTPDVPGLHEDVICTITNGEGPRVILCGGIHGDEYEPQIVLRELIAAIQPEDVRGALVIIPTINPSASQHGGRISPVDGKNMNRTFPGKADGTVTERMSAFLHDTVFPGADLLVDVHSGGQDYRVVPMVFGFTSDRCRIDQAGLEKILDDWGYPFIEYVGGIASTSAGAAPLAGVTAVEIEGGGGGALSAEELRIMRDGILRGLRAYGVLTGGPAPSAAPAPGPAVRVDVGAANNHPAPHDGVVQHCVSLGDKVETGEVAALLHPTHGSDATPTEIRAAGPGIILRQRAPGFVRKGDLLFNTGTLRV